MPIIRVKDKYQLTLPAALRAESGIQIGDIVEARLEKGKFTLTPKTIVDRIPQALKDVRAQTRSKGLDKIPLDEIATEVAAVRAGWRDKKSPGNRRSA